MLFVIVNYNTTQLTTCACSSILKFHHDASIIIFDNSDRETFKDNAKLFNALYIDNTQSQLIDFEKELQKYPNRTILQQKAINVNFGSAKHSMSIQWLLDNIDEPFILCDSDILLKHTIDFIDMTKICISDIDEKHANKGIYRIFPFIAFLNSPLIKEYKIRFFDGNRMHALTTERGFWYDTGAAFFENIMNYNSSLFKRINYNDYVIHFKAGSWKNFDKQLLIKYKNLWR